MTNSLPLALFLLLSGCIGGEAASQTRTVALEQVESVALDTQSQSAPVPRTSTDSEGSLAIVTLPGDLSEIRQEVQETREEIDRVDQQLDVLLLRLRAMHPDEYQQVQDLGGERGLIGG